MTILCYHSVEPSWTSPLAVTPQAFGRHCAWLARARSMVKLPEAISRLDSSGRLPRKMATMTFDDGFEALYEHAWPVLARHKMGATVFIVAETLVDGGKPVDWVETPPPFPLKTLTLEQIHEMQHSGIQFESHSYSHADLTTLGEAECERDLRASREVLEDLLGRRVSYLAYPRGKHNAKVRRAAARAGFSHAFSLPERYESRGDYAVPRVGVYGGNGTATIRVKTSRLYLLARTNRAYPLARSLFGRPGTSIGETS